MRKAVVVCVLVVVLACMWSSVACATEWHEFPDTSINKTNEVIYRRPNGTICVLGSDGRLYYKDGCIVSTQTAVIYNFDVNAGEWKFWANNSAHYAWQGYVDFEEILQSNGCCVYYGPGADAEIYWAPPPTDTIHYIMIGAIPHQLTVYESILVDTNWDYIRVRVMEGEVQVYQEIGAITDYSQPFGDGRLNIPLANMGLQDGHTYIFKVYGSEDGQTWIESPYPYMAQTEFTFYQTEADEVRVMGITDEKTYAYAPMVSWRKSGKYRNAKLRVVLNSNKIYEGTASNGYVNLAYLPDEHKEYLSIGKGGFNRNTLTVIIEQPGDDYIVGSWNFWVNNDIMDMWTDNEEQPLPGVIDWNSDDSVIQQIKNTGQEAIQVVKAGFDFIPPEIMMLILLGFTLVIALRILGR